MGQYSYACEAMYIINGYLITDNYYQKVFTLSPRSKEWSNRNTRTVQAHKIILYSKIHNLINQAAILFLNAYIYIYMFPACLKYFMQFQYCNWRRPSRSKRLTFNLFYCYVSAQELPSHAVSCMSELFHACCMMKLYIKDGKCAISRPMHTLVCIGILRAPP